MPNGPRPNTNSRQPEREAPIAARSKRRSRPDPKRSQNAEKNYERYLTLARAEALNGNTIGAENYYQYAEHYYRAMASE